ncbi:hypothetical protein [Wolbachia pipientis]|nr:hypothetical protein [Wolbachia pipientis]MCM1002358.1 hypothetical protein [Wolbachia pipientis]
MTRRGATGVTRRECWNDGRRRHWDDTVGVKMTRKEGTRMTGEGAAWMIS